MLKVIKLTVSTAETKFYTLYDASGDIELNVMADIKMGIQSISNAATGRTLTAKKWLDMATAAITEYLVTQSRKEMHEASLVSDEKIMHAAKSVVDAKLCDNPNPDACYIVVQKHAEEGDRYLRSVPTPYGSNDQWVTDRDRATLFTKGIAELAISMYCPKRHPGKAVKVK